MQAARMAELLTVDWLSPKAETNTQENVAAAIPK